MFRLHDLIAVGKSGRLDMKLQLWLLY